MRVLREAGVGLPVSCNFSIARSVVPVVADVGAGFPLHLSEVGADCRPVSWCFLTGAMPKKTISRKATRPVGRKTGDAAPRSAQGDQWRAWALCLLLAVVIFAVYFPALRHPFVIYDDVDYVSQNRQVQQGLTLETFRWALTSMEFSNWHPLTWMSHALDCELFGLDAGGHHFTSLLLHSMDAVILFLLLSRMTGKMGRSLMVALLFGLHPVNVESVAWIAERKTVLSMLFLLLALWAYLWYARKPGLARHGCVDALFALALAAKPMAVTFPFILLLMDYWPLQRIKSWQSPSETLALPQFPPLRLLTEKLPMFALSAASCTVTVIAQHRVAMKAMEAFPLRDRVVNALFSYVMYLWKFVWPVHLSVFYAPQGARLAIWQAASCLAFLAAISILVWRERRTRPYFLFGWLWFLGTMVPMIGIVQVGDQGMADRYAYLPHVGIFVAVVWGLADLAHSKRVEPRWSAAAACAVLLVLFVLTRGQLRNWESSYTLFTHSLQVTPDNYVAEDIVGTALLQDAFRTTGQKCAPAARLHFENAVRIYPEDALGHIDLGYCRESQGNLQEAAKEYQAALQGAHSKFLKKRALINLAGVYRAQRQFALARNSYNECLKIDPGDPDALKGLARVDKEEKMPSLEQTIDALARAAAEHPDAKLYLQLGKLQRAAGRVPEALISYQRALDLDSNLEEARVALEELEASR
jgi:tetratricopeptide (TPR) repeat protein